LPPFDLLAQATKETTHNANARYQAQIIEETLHGFGIPVEVVEINSGPTVIQFGLKLGTLERKLSDGTITEQRVRVRKVVALANDLALALSAAPIRIEAPVPGRPLVGIEVPNSEKTMVSLRAIIEAKSFKSGSGALRMALGKGVGGQAVSAPLAEMPHLLIAGATGSGKSVCLNALITTLLMTHAPEQLRFLMIDPKMVELTSFNGIPHLLAPVVTDFEQVVGALAWVTREMERRYKLFSSSGARSISSYNQKVGGQGEPLPYMVVVIDELADLMMMAPDDVERHICRIAQMARATGIHLVIATQRPSTDVVTGLIKANFPTRIAFAVSSQIDSRVILDTPGAERLLGRGDMLYMASDSPKLARLQGCFVSDAEIKNIVDFWQASRGSPTQAIPGQAVETRPEQMPWADILAEADKDELLEEAVKLVIDSNRASTSLLQRRLGIGYPRASRLMDQLEEEGVIGPAEGSKPREVRWNDPRDEADDDEFERDVG
jgi:S-DNA-T family DNA segregation ATPase FtsK/SpoIIIE